MLSKLKYTLVLCLMVHSLYAQQVYKEPDSLKTGPYISLDQSLIISGKKALPYWFFNNNSNRLKETDYLGTWTRLQLTREKRKQGLDYFYGFEVNAFAGNQVSSNVTQAYAGLESRYIRLSAGIQEEFFGINDSTLSIGNLFYGNNARPIPKIIIRTPGWLNIPFSNKKLSFKGYWAHGWLEEDRFQSKAFLHQKYAYLRINLLDNRLHLIGGLHHAAQWSGVSQRTGARQPSGLIDFARVFIAYSGGLTADQNDQLNALGNHLGSSDLRASLKLKKITVSNYWQFLWEDSSGLTPFNWRDGLFGISVKINSKTGLIHGANLEIIRTNHQDAFKTSEQGDSFIEPDNFFNNTIYKDGWSYRDRALANPVFIFRSSSPSSINKVLNRVNGVNVAVNGAYKNISYYVQVRHFKNSGTHFESFDPRFKLTSVEANLEMPIKNARLGLKGVFESGNYPRNNAGLIFTYSRRFNFGKK